MRLRLFAIPAVAALAYFAIQHRSELPAPPDPAALIMSLRNQTPPFRFTLDTEPQPPSCDAPVMLKVHVIDAAGKPADGLSIEADASLSGTDHGAQHVTLRGKGHGNYEGKVELQVAGSWEVDLSATKDLQRGKQRLSLEVGGAQGTTEPRNPNEDNSES